MLAARRTFFQNGTTSKIIPYRHLAGCTP